MTHHVVVIDEQSDSRALMAEFLADFGYRTTTAASVAETQRVRGGAGVDLFLVDSKAASRYCTARAAREALVDLGVPLILVAPADVAERAPPPGVSAYIARPVGLQSLLSTVRRVLNAQREPVSGAATARVQRPQPVAMGQRHAAELFALPFRDARAAFERCYFQHQLRQAHKGRADLSTRIGLERTHLYRKLRQLGLDSAHSGAGTGSERDDNAAA